MLESADSTEVKDVVQSRMQNQKNDNIEVPIALDSIPNLFDDSEEMKESAADSHNTEDKGKAWGSAIAHDEAKHINTLGSIDDCLEFFFRDALVTCPKCPKVAKLPETSGIEIVEPIMASINVNTTVDVDQTELSDRKTCSNEKDLASCSRANEKAESREGVQKVAPSCLPTGKLSDLLSSQDIQDTSTQKQDSGKHVLDDHSARRVEETQNEQTDDNDSAIQTQLISKLPPVLIIQLKKYAPDLSKMRGHVRFEEILQLGPFMDHRY
jgi:ubiquitin carboxyl-terminal hydrolase 16/45